MDGQSSTSKEGIEIHPMISRPCLLTSYKSIYSILEGYDIDKAQQIVETEAWQNAESFLKPWGRKCVSLIHFAACRGNIRLLNRAVVLRANIYATDKFGRSALHYAARKGRIGAVEWLLKYSPTTIRKSNSREDQFSVHPQLSLQDEYGRTALHLAVEYLHVKVVRIMVNSGAKVNVFDNQGLPPLLLAHCNVKKISQHDNRAISRYEKIVEILVAASASTTVVDSHTGWSALHYAVELNNPKIADLIIKTNAKSISCRNYGSGTTPMHVAAKHGSNQAMDILLNHLPSSSINALDKCGWSPLHFAAAMGNLECIRTLVDKGGNLAQETPQKNTVIELLSMFKHDADLATFLTNLFDAKATLVDMDESPAQVIYGIKLDFKALMPQGQNQMAVISALINALPRTEQITILQHPILEIYLWEKWSRVRYIFYTFVIIHVLFLLLLSCYPIVSLREGADSSILRRMLMTSACIQLLHNLLQFSVDPRYYCTQFENWLSLICLAITIVVAVTGEFHLDAITAGITENRDDQSSWIRESISVAILLVWIRMIILAGQLPGWGFYALIFSTVLKNVLKVLCIGVCILLSFTLSFSVLFHGRDHFDNPFNAFIKTVVMMTGEYEYNDLFFIEMNNSTGENFAADKNQRNFRTWTSKIIFLVFVLLASIILMNLMIGLAVNDIQGLLKEGKFSRLLNQATFIAHCERLANSRIFNCCLVPVRLRNVLKSTIDPGKTLLWIWGEERHQNISRTLWKKLFKLGSNNRQHDAQQRNDYEEIVEQNDRPQRKSCKNVYVELPHPANPRAEDNPIRESENAFVEPYDSIGQEALYDDIIPRSNTPVDGPNDVDDAIYLAPKTIV